MSAPGRSQALMPEPFKGEGAPVSAPGRSQALMPEPFKGEGAPLSRRGPASREAAPPPQSRNDEDDMSFLDRIKSSPQSEAGAP
ncbi:MAG: hypothetical protein KGJ30_19320, partial [Burkholderiales bacterium]|nr:hypothetical protein [Burkholderiales bacterium]